MISRRAWINRTLMIATAGVGAEQLWRHGHDYVFTEQFVIVEPGEIFRGAWQKPWPMRRIVQNHKIKTIVALAHPADHYLSVRERDQAAELGVKWVHIPIVDNRGTNDRAAEDAVSDLLEQAAAVIANPENQPVFFHCHHGLNRTSMVQIAYRTKYCGWTLAQASAEIERSVGLVKVNHGPDYRHMVSFYENRVLPFRGRQSSAMTETKPDITARVEQKATTQAVVR